MASVPFLTLRDLAWAAEVDLLGRDVVFELGSAVEQGRLVPVPDGRPTLQSLSGTADVGVVERGPGTGDVAGFEKWPGILAREWAKVTGADEVEAREGLADRGEVIDEAGDGVGP